MGVRAPTCQSADDQSADERLLDPFHAARSSRSKIYYELEPRYGIEP
jgi:hypothetical protein